MDLSQLGVFQATSFKAYIPSANLLPRAWSVMFLDAASVVSFVDKEGVTSTSVSLPAGYQPFLVQAVTACSGGNCYILSSKFLL